jgi:hypothetical protein
VYHSNLGLSRFFLDFLGFGKLEPLPWPSMSLNLDGMIHEVQAVVLENDWIRASVLPAVGAKIYDLIWKPTGRNTLWHNPRILPQS